MLTCGNVLLDSLVALMCMIFVMVLCALLLFFVYDTAPTVIYTYGHTLSLHDALPISCRPAIVDTTATDVGLYLAGLASERDTAARLEIGTAAFRDLQIGRAHV